MGASFSCRLFVTWGLRCCDGKTIQKRSLQRRSIDAPVPPLLNAETTCEPITILVYALTPRPPSTMHTLHARRSSCCTTWRLRTVKLDAEAAEGRLPGAKKVPLPHQASKQCSLRPARTRRAP